MLFQFYWTAVTALEPDSELYDYKHYNPFPIGSPILGHITAVALSPASQPRTPSDGCAFLERVHLCAGLHPEQREENRASGHPDRARVRRRLSVGALMAGSLLGSLPVAIFYSFFVDYHVSSLTGAVKE